ncbi:shikimate kinase AroK [Permianibacter aggregans]|uniref:Shikimate kinase n=1 Tax=Permianibacter aggregans TaxID=1510150 RepID=A0A4R6UQ99_9GAMM|nr:shikimate kinase AroK [Permianibacter aggregans]QGX40440.1 shikimate kinase AroK [Permianibacter aggregans]TDQ49420.1 shikimate kinase [Permianibacter aggregans]
MKTNKRNIFLIGPMGAGKTTIGKQVAQLLKMEFIDADQEIEDRAGAPIDWIFELEGEEGFRKREVKIIDELTLRQGIVLATGGGAIVAKENRIALAGRGAVVFLETSIDQQLERTRKDKRRPLLQTDDPKETLEELAENRDELYREIADYIVSTDRGSVKSVAKDIVDMIQSD